MVGIQHPLAMYNRVLRMLFTPLSCPRPRRFRVLLCVFFVLGLILSLVRSIMSFTVLSQAWLTSSIPPCLGDLILCELIPCLWLVATRACLCFARHRYSTGSPLGFLQSQPFACIFTLFFGCRHIVRQIDIWAIVKTRAKMQPIAMRAFLVLWGWCFHNPARRFFSSRRIAVRSRSQTISLSSLTSGHL